MAFITINYDEGNKKDLGYKSVEIHHGNEEKKFFNTGNFVKDWYDMRKFMIQNLLDSEMHFSCSSSVDHFIMNDAPYDSAYLHTTDDGKPVLKYIDRTKAYYPQYEEIIEGIEFFVPEGTQPTFEELKEMCK
jgi:hypothetical protein